VRSQNEDAKDNAARLLGAGFAKAEVARITGVGRSTLYRWLEDAQFQETIGRHRAAFDADAERRLLVQAQAALSSVLTDPRATAAQRVRAAEAAHRLLGVGEGDHGSRASRKPSPSPSKQYGLLVSEMPENPNPDTEYVLITPEVMEEADRLVWEAMNLGRAEADIVPFEEWRRIREEQDQARGPISIPFWPEAVARYNAASAGS